MPSVAPGSSAPRPAFAGPSSPPSRARREALRACQPFPCLDRLVEGAEVVRVSPRKRPDRAGDMMQGTLDMLVLQTLVLGPAHGYAIAELIQKRSDAVLQVEQGSLYPALHRLEDKGLITSFW